MPLTTCPDCQASVSTRAPSCPHCGCPLGGPQPPRRVLTPDDLFLTRNRGCGDLVLYGALGLIILVILTLHSC